MKISIPSTIAKLVHLNTRKEKNGEENRLAADLDFAIDVDGEEILKQLCIGDYSPLLSALWCNDAQGSVREPSIQIIRMNHKLEGQTLRFSTDLEDNLEGKNVIVATDVTIKKLRLEAKNGMQIHLRLQAQVYYTKNELSRYAEGLKQETVRITIEPGPQLELAVNNDEKQSATQ